MRFPRLAFLAEGAFDPGPVEPCGVRFEPIGDLCALVKPVRSDPVGHLLRQLLRGRAKREKKTAAFTISDRKHSFDQARATFGFRQQLDLAGKFGYLLTKLIGVFSLTLASTARQQGGLPAEIVNQRAGSGETSVRSYESRFISLEET